MELSLLIQALYSFIVGLSHFAGGYVASLAKEELNDLEKILNWLIIVLVSVSIGIISSSKVPITYVLAIAIVSVLIILTILKGRDLLLLEITILIAALIVNQMLALQVIMITILLQGIIDYKKYLFPKKKNKKLFLYRTGMIVIITIVICGLTHLVMWTKFSNCNVK